MASANPAAAAAMRDMMTDPEVRNVLILCSVKKSAHADWLFQEAWLRAGCKDSSSVDFAYPCVVQPA